MYRHILVPYDGSAHSARAIPVAAALARKTGATVQLALVHDPSAFIPFVPGEVAIPVYDQELMQSRLEDDRRLLDAAVARLKDDGIDATGVLLEGTIIEALEEHAERSGTDLTVLTTHGRSGFERLRLGSVAAQFLTRATTPVLLVRGAGSEAPDDEAGALPTGSLLCPLDGSPFSESILPHARTFAEVTGMTLKLVAVTVPHAIPMAPFGAEALLADDSALVAEESGREEYLARMAATCPAGTQTVALTDMSVARALLDVASSPVVGAIAMATHGRGGFKRFMLGSVTDEVIRHAHVPMLVYRPPA
jgi:nucleotide-binding universal stress UspA family protein